MKATPRSCPCEGSC
ncbi:hypothetical protein SM139_2429, partial [Stenotrophomonas maltophilia]